MFNLHEIAPIPTLRRFQKSTHHRDGLVPSSCCCESQETARSTAHRIPPFAGSSAWSGTLVELDQPASWQ